MVKPSKENTAVTISRERKNGLSLKTAQMGTHFDSVTLDIILRDAGVLELSEEQLAERLEKMEVAAR